MAFASEVEVAADLSRCAQPLTGVDDDFDALLDQIGDRRIVLLGEATHGTHGTHDFYRERARITKRLIEEKGFTAVAVEADWPDAYRVNRYVLGQSSDVDADAALSDFERFPSWMWRNADVVRFVEWLRARNDAHRHLQTKARFYGLDLYSLRASMHAVITYLDTVDPLAASAARDRYSCFDHVAGEGPEYGHSVELNITVPCEQEVIAELIDLRRSAARLLANDGFQPARRASVHASAVPRGSGPLSSLQGRWGSDGPRPSGCGWWTSTSWAAP